MKKAGFVFAAIHGVILLLSIYLSTLPLIGDFHYEFAAVFSLVFFVGSGFYTFSIHQKQSNITLSDTRLILLKTESFIIIPLLLIATVAGFYRESAYLEGLPFFAVYVVPAPFLGAVSAIGISGVFKRFRKTVFLMLCFAIALLPLIEMYLYPAVRFYNPLITFFPGTIYDEHILFKTELVWYRLCNVLYFSGILIPVILQHVRVAINRKRLLKEANNTSSGTLFKQPVKTSTETADDNLIFDSIDKIEQTASINLNSHHKYSGASRLDTLPGKPAIGNSGKLFVTIGTGYTFFIIWLIAGVLFFILSPVLHAGDSVKTKQAGVIHEAYYSELTEIFGSAPQKIRSYMFPGSGFKYALIGAGVADVSKPHQESIFMNEGDIWGTTKHEMAHAFTSGFGFSPFKLAYMFNPLLIEGAASATSEVFGDYDSHFLASLILQKKCGISLEIQFTGLNFFSASSVSYVLSASFCRYIIAAKGIAVFKKIYQSGFETTGELSFAVIESDYHKWMQTKYPASSIMGSDTNIYHYYFGRVPLYERRFPHTVARLMAECSNLYASGKYADAEKMMSKIEKYTSEPDAVTLKILILSANGKTTEAIRLAEKQLLTTTSPRMTVYLYRRLGDLYALQGNITEARKYYTLCTQSGVRNRLTALAEAGNILLHEIDSLGQNIRLDKKDKQQMTERMLKQEPSVVLLWYYLYITSENKINTGFVKSVVHKILTAQIPSTHAVAVKDIAGYLILHGMVNEAGELTGMSLETAARAQRANLTELLSLIHKIKLQQQ
ncbi:MAG: tetratricopeptide repeat protein [Ignavibacteriales bacterium]|nr:tetratricopeptide repeat protein [Ignavibacteriales bacterium]